MKTLTSIIFMCTAGHAAVNLPQYDEYGYSPNYPTLLVGEPPYDTVCLLVICLYHLCLFAVLLIFVFVFVPALA